MVPANTIPKQTSFKYPNGRYARHGLSSSRTYKIWRSIKERCLNPKMRCYSNYGGRGIRICDCWMNFFNFVKDMGICPPDLTIDRVNNNGDYEPSNCRWATRKQQGNNKRVNVNLTSRGRTMTVAQWAESVGIKAPTIRRRLKSGWSVDRALYAPITNRGSRIKLAHDGKTFSIARWTRMSGLSKNTIYQRIKKGWPVEKLLMPPTPRSHRRDDGYDGAG